MYRYVFFTEFPKKMEMVTKATNIANNGLDDI